MKVIITGATGMVGEGVLFECLQNAAVTEILLVSRKHYKLEHPKLKELIVPDFFSLNNYTSPISGYDACFFCAGVSSVGKSAEKYKQLTYDTTLAFARVLLEVNPQMVFTYVSGALTDSTEKGKLTWARVKGKTENDLMKLGFRDEYNFRPGAMVPFPGQKNWKTAYRLLAKAIKIIAPKSVLTMQVVGRAMINAVKLGYPKKILEVADISVLGRQ